jgi:hypothetical protein
MNHEEALIKAFILPSKRERYLGFLSTSKGRAKIISELTHFKALDPRFMKSIIPSQHDPASVVRLCRSKGAGATCWDLGKLRFRREGSLIFSAQRNSHHTSRRGTARRARAVPIESAESFDFNAISVNARSQLEW